MTENKPCYKRNFKILINATTEEIQEREPLLAFSFALSTRHNQLADIADEILDNLDKGMSSKFIDMRYVTRAGILTWLWTLGAYEIVRTMCQAKECFAPNCHSELQELKKRLAKVRMPDSKMEKQGKKEPVNSNRSPWCEMPETKDLLIGDPEEPDYARQIIDKYFTVVNSIKRNQVLARHEESYE